jgi:anti-sigma regulatory factor (Ser/Thr protein kinase)
MSRLLVVHRDARMDPVLAGCAGTGRVEVEQVPDYGRALARLEQKPFDALLTPLTTSVQADLAFLREARRFRPAIRAVLMAESATRDEVLSALRAQVFAVLTEPLDVDRAVDMVVKAATDAEIDGIQVVSAVPHWITLRVRARLLTADRVVTFMEGLHGRLFDPSTRDDLLMAFREILLNAIEHGAGFDPEKDVLVTAIRSKRALSFHFRDPGPGFAANHVPQAAVDGDPLSHIDFREGAGLRPGGFGLMVARQLVDEMIHNELGNEVVLVKHLS